jgi:hypothetical protein
MGKNAAVEAVGVIYRLRVLACASSQLEMNQALRVRDLSWKALWAALQVVAKEDAVSEERHLHLRRESRYLEG